MRLPQSFDCEAQGYFARLDCVPVQSVQRLLSVFPTTLKRKPFRLKG